MRIEKLTIKDLEVIQSAEIDLRGVRLAVFIGPNWSGKTTVLNAIQLLARGTLPGLPASESSILTRMQSKAKGWRVEATLTTIEGEQTIYRTPSRLCRRDESGKGLTIKEADLRRIIGAEPDILAACCGLGGLITMSERERVAMIQRVAGVRLDEEGLRKEGLSDPEIVSLAAAGEWRKAEKLACEKKRAAARAVKEIQKERPEAPILDLGKMGKVSAAEADDATIDKLKEYTARIEKSLYEMIRRQGEKAGRSEGELDAMRKRLREIEETLARHNPELTTKELRLAKKEGELAQARLDEIGRERTKLEVRKTKAMARMKEIAAMEERKDPGEHNCPICGFLHAAPKGAEVGFPAPEIEGEKKKLEEEIKTIGAEEQTLRAEQGSISETVRQIRQISKDLLRRSFEMDEAKKEAARLAAQIKEAESAEGQDENLEQTIERQQGLLQRGKDILGKIAAYRQAMEDYKRQEERCRILGKEAESYRKQELLCRPDGIQAKIVEPLVVRINKAMEPWVLDLSFGLSVMKDLSLSVEGRPLAALSGAERWYAEVSLSAAVASLSRLNFLAIDEAAALDQFHRKGLSRILYPASRVFDQILVAAPNAKEPPPAPPAESGVAIFLVEGGHVERLGGKADG